MKRRCFSRAPEGTLQVDYAIVSALKNVVYSSLGKIGAPQSLAQRRQIATSIRPERTLRWGCRLNLPTPFSICLNLSHLRISPEKLAFLFTIFAIQDRLLNQANHFFDRAC
jgi:hypothetical protein